MTGIHSSIVTRRTMFGLAAGALAAPAALASPRAAPDPHIAALAERITAAEDHHKLLIRKLANVERDYLDRAPCRPKDPVFAGLDDETLNETIRWHMRQLGAWNAERERVKAAVGLPDIEAEIEAAQNEQTVLIDELCSTPARDLASLIAKARVARIDGEVAESIVDDLLALPCGESWT